MTYLKNLTCKHRAKTEQGVRTEFILGYKYPI
jgi:hypothetical protein